MAGLVPVCAQGGGTAPAPGFLPGSRPPTPWSPARSRAVSGRQADAAGGSGGWGADLATGPQAFTGPRPGGEPARLQRDRECVYVCVCTRASVYLPSNLSVYSSVCRDEGADGVSWGRAPAPTPVFCPPGWFPPPHCSPAWPPQQRPMYLRLFWMMTSVTASNTNWMLLVSVAQVKCE